MCENVVGDASALDMMSRCRQAERGYLIDCGSSSLACTIVLLLRRRPQEAGLPTRTTGTSRADFDLQFCYAGRGARLEREMPSFCMRK